MNADAKPRVVLLFADGVGIGRHDSLTNPFFAGRYPVLQRLFGGDAPHLGRRSISSPHVDVFPVNATLGVTGLPQSGTGQATLFTGVNGAKMFGRHFGPYPPSLLRPVLEQKNIFRQLLDRGNRVTFANAFPKQFFDYTASGTRRLSVSTLSCVLTGVRLLTQEELKTNRGISADLTRLAWPGLGHPDVVPVTARQAGEHLWEISRDHDFTLFEYWLTDHAGHSQEMTFAVRVLEDLDAFLGGFFDHFDPGNDLFVFISDHGNVEDLSTKSHTRNPVPCIVAGRQRRHWRERIRSLRHITPAIVQLLGGT